MALVIALMVMVVLMLMGSLFLTASLTESTISSNEKNHSQAFQLADAGIEHARKALIPLSPTAVLNGTAVFGASNTATLGAGGSYTIVVSNNIASEGFPRGTIPADTTAGSCTANATTDCDRILVVKSTGNFQGTEKIVEAIIRVPGPVSGAVYMMNGFDPNPSVKFEALGGASSISGIDCNPPSVGGSPVSPENVPGIVTHSDAAVSNVEADIGVNNPNVTGVNGNGDVVNLATTATPAISPADFDVWVASLIADATPAGTGNCLAGQLGTPANPQICHIPSSPPNALNTYIPNNSSGAGILILNDIDPTLPEPSASTVQNFTYEGIIIVVGGGRFRMKGNTKIYGAVIQRNITTAHSQETRLKMEGNSDICYSSRAVQNARATLRPSLMAWYEK